MLTPHDIHTAVAEVCPIDGMRFPVFEDKATWETFYAEDATDEQKAAAQAVIDEIDIYADPVPEVISNRQFYHQWTIVGRLTQSEAKKAMTGVLPRTITDIIGSQQPGDQFRIEMAYLAIKFERPDQTVTLMQEKFGLPDDYMDQFFRDAAAL
jgi:hypothetical protein